MLASVAAPLLLYGADKDWVVLKGVYDYSLYQGSQAPLFSSRYGIEVSIKGCLWNIQYADSSAQTNSDLLVVRSIASCDGTNVYVVQFQSEGAVKKAWGDRYESEKAKLPAVMVSIYKGVYPPPKEPPLQHIWLALAAPSCVIHDPEGKAKPLSVVDMALFDNPAHVCRYRWLADDKGTDLRKLLLLSDGEFLARDERGEIRHLKYGPPYDKGYTLGVGSWLQATNVGGLSFPVGFEYTAFFPKPGGSNSTDLLKSFAYKCTITNISSREAPPIPPALPRAKAMVSDWRFGDRGYGCVDYVVTNRWVALNDADVPVMLSKFPKVSLEKEVRDELKLPPPPSKRWIIRIIFCSLVIAPLGLFLARRLVRNKSNQQEMEN